MSDYLTTIRSICLFGLLMTLGCTGKQATKDDTSPRKNGDASNAVDKNEPSKAETDKSTEEISPHSPFDLDRLLELKLSDEVLDQGWVRLFDGQTMMGWQNNSSANWRIEEGVLVADQGEQGLLTTTSRWADYELQLEFQADGKVNSGVFLRTVDKPTDPTKDCFELNIAPVDNPFPTGSLVGRSKVEPSTLGELDPQAWHKFHVLVDGDHFQIWCDGKNIVDYKDPNQLLCGKIGLQFREGAVRFRDIRIRPLLLNSVLPAKDLSQWSQKESPAKFNLNDQGALLVEGGKGSIELLQPLGNFCLRAEVMTDSPNTNSGIFFRCIPQSDMAGYECQVNSAIVNDDRKVPADWGMGAIFRRQKARAVFSDDKTWAHVMIVADGPHIASWVEGLQVTDWTDTRKPDENPRVGQRLESGSIMIQAHDPNCKATYRLLQTMTLPD